MDLLRNYALQFAGTPYLWGGDDPIYGFDCSGFCQELLASVGMDPPGDQTAQSLFNLFEKNSSWNVLACGSLAFYGKSSTEIIHIAMMLDQYRVIEAGGGNSHVVDRTSAADHNAYIRIRLLKYRPDFLCTLRPRYAPIGVT